MKLSELRVCDGCGGPLFVPPARWFQVVRSSGAIVRPEAMEVAEIAARSGVSIAQAEAQMAIPADHAVDVLGDLASSAGVELFICVRCYNNRTVSELVRCRRTATAAAALRAKAS